MSKQDDMLTAWKYAEQLYEMLNGVYPQYGDWHISRRDIANAFQAGIAYGREHPEVDGGQ